jgi:methionyl-tRNA formyltransferase
MTRISRNSRILVIGDGSMASDVVSRLGVTQGIGWLGWMYHSADEWSKRRVAALASKHLDVTTFTIAHVADSDSRRILAEIRPDLILNVNSFDIIPPDMLGIAAGGIINFHNGPLPDYRGVNIPSWALINGELRHGVTWHFVTADIDSGPIVTSAEFDIASDETAISLTFSCILEGLNLLPGIISRHLEGQLSGKLQTRGKGRYYSRKDVPNDGVLEIDWPGSVLDRFLRGLNFHPFPNSFVRPRIVLPSGRWFQAEYGEFIPEIARQKPGTLQIGPANSLDLTCRDGLARLYELRDDHGAPLKATQIVPYQSPQHA